VPGKTALKISDAVERLFRAGKALDMTGISFHKLASRIPLRGTIANARN
jgi:hypothetical protein